MNKKILSIVLVGAMSIGSLGMAYADDQNDAYKDNKELQEIYKVYENADENNYMALAPNPMAEENIEIKVAKDGYIELKLEENITTGCTWHVEIENEDILKVDADEYKSMNENDDKNIICGAPGVHIWKFKALKEGTTKVTFKLYQGWEPDNVYDTKEYNVIVEKDGEKQIYVNPYVDNKELQETFKVYENTDENKSLLLAPVDADGAIDQEKEEESNLFQRLVQLCLDIFSM